MSYKKPIFINPILKKVLERIKLDLDFKSLDEVLNYLLINIERVKTLFNEISQIEKFKTENKEN